ncbi:MAG: tetratricopeptide repeat protein, partial [Roseiflexaceae bacterium]
MTHASASWLQAYLQTLCEHPQFAQARSVVPLWLAHEGVAELADRSGLTPPASRVTIQMAAELFTRMALLGPAGAGKTTLLRQLAIGLAETLRAGERGGERRGEAILPIPLYVDLALFKGSIEEAIADYFDLTQPILADLAAERPLLFLLDGLDELAPSMQLAGMAAISATLTGLGTQARWIAACRNEALPLFRPWLDMVEVRGIRPLLPRDLLGTIESQNPELASWLQRTEDLVSLATRPRWLAGLMSLRSLATLKPPFSRGRLLAAWVPAVVAATLEAHPTAVTTDEALLVLPELALALQQNGTIGYTEAGTLLESERQSVDPRAILQLLSNAGILTIDAERQSIGFRHPTLRSFAQALHLAQLRPDQWPAMVFNRAWSDSVVISYSLCDDPEMVLRRLLASDAIELTARCLIDAEIPEYFEQLLTRSGTLTPPLRVLLADAFASEGMTAVALDQLERAGAEGYDEAGLFGRLGDLYSGIGQWRHARVAYEQALTGKSQDLHYRQRLGVIYSRLGEFDQAAVALQAVVEEQERRLAEAAHELGHVYLEQGKIDHALESYRRAIAGLPDESIYQRSAASALRLLGRTQEAETLLRGLLAEDSSEAAIHAELGLVYADAGQTADAIRCYLKAVGLRPTEARFYAQIGRLRDEQGDLSGARAALQRAAELDSSDATLYFALGQACERSGELDAALAAYRHATRIDTSNAAYYRRLGALLRAQGDNEEAANALHIALKLHADCAETHAELAGLFWQQGAHEQALGSYRQALTLAPDCADYEYAIGNAYRALGKMQAAAQHLHRAVDLAPARADLHYAAGQIAEVMQQESSALAAYERATTLAPEQPLYARSAAALHMHWRNHSRARTLLAAALHLNRRDPATLYQVGLLHIDMGHVSRAIHALDRAASIGRSAQYYHQLGQAFARAARFEEACATFRQARQIEPNNSDILYHYSLTLMKCDYTEEAYDAAQRAAQLAVGDAMIQLHAGSLALQLGRLHEALALLDQAVALDSGVATAHLNRASILLQQQQPQAALIAARAALVIEPKLAPAALIAGQALVLLGQISAARNLFERALTSDPQLVAAHAGQRDLLAGSGEVEAAIAAARSAAALDDHDAWQALRLGELLLMSGDLDAAFTAIKHALQCDPNLVEAHARMSQICAGLAAWDRARYHAEHAITLDPDNGEYHALLAVALAGAGDPVAASARFVLAIERAPDRADWHYALGLLYRQAGDAARALPCLQRAAQQAEDRAEYHYALAGCLAALDKRDRAIASLEQALRLRPTMPEWRADLVELQLDRGWYGEALAEINQAINTDASLGRLWRLRADVHMRLNQYDAARLDLIEALRRTPNDPANFALLTELMISQGALDRALEAARRTVALEPADAAKRKQLAHVLRLLDRRAEAAEELQNVLDDTSPADWWADLADDCEATNQIERAGAAWAAAVTATPNDPMLLFRYGCLLARSGDAQNALRRLWQAVELQPDFAAAHAQIATIALQIDEQHAHAGTQQSGSIDRAIKAIAAESSDHAPNIDIDAGIESARRAVILQPQQSEYWRILGTALHRKQLDGEALQALRRSHELAPADPQPAFLLGLIALEQGATTDAITALRAAVQSVPDSAQYQGHLGIAIRQTAMLSFEPDDLRTPPAEVSALGEARIALERAALLAPEQRRWHYELGLVNQILSRHDQATASFDRALACAADIRHTIDVEPVPVQDIHYRRGLSHYIAGRTADARADLERALTLDPRQQASTYLLGRIAAETGDLATAKQLLEDVVANHAAHFQAQLYLGRALLTLVEPAAALVALERAAEIQPDHAEAAAFLSDAYAANKRHERALVAAARAVRLAPSSAANHQRLATLYATAGRLNEARTTLLNALTLEPNQAAWHAQMSDICARLGMHDAARNALASAVRLDPAATEHRYALARLLVAQGRTAEAKTEMEQALLQSPDQGAWHYELGQLYQQLGEETSGLEHYAVAVGYSPDIAEHWQALALVQQRCGLLDAARETLERGLLRFGEHAPMHLAIGTLFEDQRSYDLAAWHYQIATLSDPQSAEHWWRLGRTQLEIGDYQNAASALEHALKLDPRSAGAHAAFAHLLVQTDDLATALIHSQHAITIEPNNPTSCAQHGDILARLRRCDEAYQALGQAVALAPANHELLAQYGEIALNIG